MSGPTGAPAPKAGGFDDTVRDFWESRPRRPRRGRKIAGVAAAVGNRYGIDPVLVRVALVVATVIGGFGLLLYLLGWLFFPEENDETSAVEALLGRGRSSTPHGLTVALCIALIPVASGTLGGMWFNGGGLIGLALLGAGLYLLHRNRGHENRPTVPAAGAHGFGPSTFGAAPFGASPASFHAAPPSEEGGDRVEAVVEANAGSAAPPAWDPLGAAPLAWDLPDPAPVASPAPPRPPRQRSKVVPMTIGLAFVVAGVSTALTVVGVPWFSAAHTVGLTLTVLGLGMVVGAFAGGGRGLVALAVPLSLAGIVLTSVPMHSLNGEWGERHLTPRTAAEVDKRYALSGGSVRLDLTQVPYSEAPLETAVSVTMGEAVVIVPADANVTYTCAATMGEVNCLGQERGGPRNEPVTGTDPGTPGGQSIVVDVSATMGSVEVRRG